MKQKLLIDNTWTLFLDRDGVINKRLEGYVTTPEAFEFLPQVKEAVAAFRKYIGCIVVVTNQQGVGKGLMTHGDLEKVHQKMQKHLSLDAIYVAPQLKSENSPYRKPNVGMALQAQKDFPQINFKKSIMIGDTVSDMQFGKKLKMTTIFVPSFEPLNEKYRHLADFEASSLFACLALLDIKSKAH